MQNETSYEFSDGEIRVWLEQETIHITAMNKAGDPAEITKERALELANALKKLSDLIHD